MDRFELEFLRNFFALIGLVVCAALTLYMMVYTLGKFKEFAEVVFPSAHADDNGCFEMKGFTYKGVTMGKSTFCGFDHSKGQCAVSFDGECLDTKPGFAKPISATTVHE